MMIRFVNCGLSSLVARWRPVAVIVARPSSLVVEGWVPGTVLGLSFTITRMSIHNHIPRPTKAKTCAIESNETKHNTKQKSNMAEANAYGRQATGTFVATLVTRARPTIICKVQDEYPSDGDYYCPDSRG